MTRKIVTAKPDFIKAIKAEIENKKQRHEEYMKQIKPEASNKLKKMYAA